MMRCACRTELSRWRDDDTGRVRQAGVPSMIRTADRHSGGLGRLLQGLRGPLVEAQAGDLRGDARARMYVGRQTQHHTPRVRLVGRLLELLARRQVVVHRFAKRYLQLLHRLTVEAHDVSNPGDVADEDAVLCIEFDAGAVTLVGHGAHGLTPIDIKKARASRTRYRSASLPG